MKRQDAVKIKRGVGGRAFPNDYNWVCSTCGRENRAFELTCQYCEHELWMRSVEAEGWGA